jgi:hypothetical protein
MTTPILRKVQLVRQGWVNVPDYVVTIGELRAWIHSVFPGDVPTNHNLRGFIKAIDEMEKITRHMEDLKKAAIELE